MRKVSCMSSRGTTPSKTDRFRWFFEWANLLLISSSQNPEGHVDFFAFFSPTCARDVMPPLYRTRWCRPGDRWRRSWRTRTPRPSTTPRTHVRYVAKPTSTRSARCADTRFASRASPNIWNTAGRVLVARSRCRLTRCSRTWRLTSFCGI